MKTIKACFTITFTDDQYQKAMDYVSDMLNHPKRVFWQGRKSRHPDDLIIEQIAHRVLSGFYKDDPIHARRSIIEMVSEERVN